MLVPLNYATWYGPAVAAAVLPAAAALDAGAKTRGRVEAALAGSGEVAYARGTRLIGSPAVLAGQGIVDRAAPKGRLRGGAVIGITGLTQSDVTGAVLEAEVEPGMTLKQALRVVLAAQGGKLAIAGNTVTIRNPADTKDRIVATTDADGQRTAVTLDVS
jgi:hypothetical protein